MTALRRNDLRELLIKCWMTHDAMWFMHCVQEFGIEKTNKINKAAVKSMALMEIKRVMKAFGFERISTFEEFKKLITQMSDIQAYFMSFSFSFPRQNVMRFNWEDQNCFAYKGMKRVGMIEYYRCAIYDRVEGWLDGLGLTYTVTPEITTCLMHCTGKCWREYTISFNAPWKGEER